MDADTSATERTRPAHGGDLVVLDGAIDMHVHTAPCIFPRLVDDIEAAEAARAAGLRAILIKSHHESTVTRARTAAQTVEGVDVFGGIVLNGYVGYANVSAVEAALVHGGKSVWMPTVHSRHHIEQHGGGNLVGLKAVVPPKTHQPFEALNEDGDVREDVMEILSLIAEHDAMLSTSHVSPAEVFALVDAARSVGVEKIVLTHPFYKAPGLSLAEVAELARRGAYAEINYTDYSPMWHHGVIEEAFELIRLIGPSRCVLVSDGGQTHNPLPPEGLRILAQSLFEKGLKVEEISRMIRTNPAHLLGIKE